MKVKSFVVGFAKGLEGAFQRLDESTVQLGNINIISCTDTLYHEDPTYNNLPAGPRVVRVIIYNCDD